MRKEVVSVEAFDISEIRRNSYNVQNMLVDQFNFPRFYHNGDFTSEIWSDRILHEKWMKLIEKYFDGNLRSFEYNAPNRRKILPLFEELCGNPITGYRIVRYTNVSSGFPTYRFDLFGKSKNTPDEKVFTGGIGENVILNKESITLDGLFHL